MEHNNKQGKLIFQDPKNIDRQRVRVLIVDDDPICLLVVESIVKKNGYSTIVFTKPTQALNYFQQHKESVDIIISDIFMPEMTGITLTSEMTKVDPDIVSIIMTSADTRENAIDALNIGAFSFLGKPVTEEALKSVLERAVERRTTRKYFKLYKDYLEEELDDKTTALNFTINRLRSAYLETMNIIVTILDKHEHETANHSHSVKDLTLILARNYGIIDDYFMKTIEYGALLHDIGKIGISDMIINKPGPLDEKERAIVNSHSLMGYEIVRTIPILQDSAEIVYSHHERYDGTGYPRRLKGDKICLGARLFAIADTFDALRTNRPYRKAVSLTETVVEINKNSGTQFDPAIVEVFNSCSQEMDRIYGKGKKF